MVIKYCHLLHHKTLQDEDAQRTEIEILNDFPALRMILNPGGCAFYQFEVNGDETNMFVQPAKKMGAYHQDFCDKVISIHCITS